MSSLVSGAFPMCLGGNVFGWTVDEKQSFAVLDAFVEAGGSFIDTADAYPPPVSGLPPGRSEEIIGSWMAARGSRDRVVIATKVGSAAGSEGLGATRIRAGIEGSLRRLGTDRVDLYYAHRDDPQTALAETMATLDSLVREGLVRELGASNYGADRLREANDLAHSEGLTPFRTIQPEYNLVERGYETELLDLCLAEGIGCVPYFGLASGFLTGKYRPGVRLPDDANIRARRAAGYLEHPCGPRVIESLEEIAADHGTSVAAAALAWLAAQPTVLAPIASARSSKQLADLLSFTQVWLHTDELHRLNQASSMGDSTRRRSSSS